MKKISIRQNGPWLQAVLLVFMASGCDGSPRQRCDDGCPSVHVRQFGIPTLFTARVDDGDWTALDPPLADGDLELCVCDVFDIVSVCEYRGGAAIAQRWTGTSEDTETVFFSGCEGGPELSPSYVTLTLAVSKRARAWLGGIGLGLRDGGSPFAFNIRKGTHDLAVSDDYVDNPAREGRALIRRSLRVDNDTELEVLDLASQGFLLHSVPFTVDGLASDDVVSAETWLHTEGGGHWMLADARGLEVRQLPEEVLQSTDAQEFRLAVRNGAYFRAYHSSSVDEVQLLPRLDGSQLTDTSYSWLELPTQEYVSMTFQNASEDGIWNRVTKSKSWLGIHDTRAISFDFDVPGLKPEWRVSAAQVRTISILDLSGDRTRASGITE